MVDLSTHKKRAERKLYRHILPVICAMYFAAYLDRANVAFAKIPMSQDLGFSEAVYGFGAGIFFLGYLLLEIPGAILVERWSARLWLARILVTWGFCTVLVGMVNTSMQFYGARFLLGVAEAGFYPGIIVYLTHWFPRELRARAMAGFIAAIPISLLIGAPLSALFLKLDWFGLPGWRWVFILEGLPAVALGIFVFFRLPDHPKDARWLEPEEREWIAKELEAERQEKLSGGKLSVWSAVRDYRVLLCALSICLANIASYVFVFWLPAMISKASGLSAELAALYSTLPFGVALACVLASGYLADRRGNPKLQTSILMASTAVFLLMSVLPGQPFILTMVWLSLAAGAIYAWPPSFWVLPTLILGETAAAVSIGIINTIGVVGAFLGPAIVGYMLTKGFSEMVTMALMSLCALAAAFVILQVTVDRRRPSSAQE